LRKLLFRCFPRTEELRLLSRALSLGVVGDLFRGRDAGAHTSLAASARDVVWSLIQALLDIALHRRGPADLPASQFLLGLVLAVYLAIGLAVLQRDATLVQAASQLGFDTLVYLGTIWLVLRLFGRSRRLVQTATAFVGTDVILNAVALPLLLWNDALAAPSAASAPQILILLLFLWSVDIGGYILSKALERPYVVGVSIMIVYVLTSMALREALFPVTA
jgi:hypothetical protein